MRIARPRKSLAAALCGAVVVLGTACGGGTSVFSGCSVDADCPVRCQRGDPEYPGGLCTASCRTNLDCAGDAVCYPRDGGVCVLLCSSQQECADFGVGYVCRDKEDTEGRLQLVCLGR